MPAYFLIKKKFLKFKNQLKLLVLFCIKKKKKKTMLEKYGAKLLISGMGISTRCISVDFHNKNYGVNVSTGKRFIMIILFFYTPIHR